MYEELVNALKEHHCGKTGEDSQEFCEECAYYVFFGKRAICVYELMHQAADAIEDLSKTLDEEAEINTALRCNMPVWVHVSERLPEEDKTVLIFSKTNRIILFDWIHDNEWSCFGDATHWMPLPDQPKDGAE